MLKEEPTVYLRIYIHISCICKNNTANRLKCGQHLIELTCASLVDPWLWNWSSRAYFLPPNLMHKLFFLTVFLKYSKPAGV